MTSLATSPDGIVELDSDRGRLLGFTTDRFDGYLWKKGDYIWVSFIVSKAKGNFRELVERICSLGMGVKVPTPLGRMTEIVRKAGYRETFEWVEKIGEAVETWVMEASSETGLDTDG